MQTATLARQSESQSALAAATHRMFHDLRRFVRVYARSEEEQKNLPEIDVTWVSEVGPVGPETVIQDAIKSCPKMWAEALPPECCVVPRGMLRKMVSLDEAEVLETYGATLVSNAAAAFRYAKLTR